MASLNSVVGNGNQVSFWNHKWVGNSELGAVFSELYAIAANPHASVGEEGCRTMVIGVGA